MGLWFSKFDYSYSIFAQTYLVPITYLILYLKNVLSNKSFGGKQFSLIYYTNIFWFEYRNGENQISYKISV